MSFDMKCCFIYQFNSKLAGGGNEFLKALHKNFTEKGYYTTQPKNAHFFLMNSHHSVEQILLIKRKYPDKLFIHRIDGPMKVYNKSTDLRDNIVRLINRYVADATIYQSKWSKQENINLKNSSTPNVTVINNAPDPDIFNTINRSKFSSDRKPRLIACSWSSNRQKGFDTLNWLDNHLDFNCLEMTFVGNSPVVFKNIKHIPPVDKHKMATLLKQSDLYIFTSKIEACSNALLEALHCGLPVIGSNSSSNPEIIKKGGELFNTPSDIPQKIELILKNYSAYQNSIKNNTLSEISDSYYLFMKKCMNEKKRFRPKRIRAFQYLHLRALLLLQKIYGKYQSLIK